MKNAHSLTAYIGYAAGFATGTFVGMLIEERMAMGTLVLRIILAKGVDELTNALRAAGFGVTSVNGEGARTCEVTLHGCSAQETGHSYQYNP